MHIVVELSDAGESLHRLTTVQDYQTIDTDALIDFTVDCYRCGYIDEQHILHAYLDTLMTVDTLDQFPDTYVKMTQDIANLIHCVLSTFDQYKLNQVLNKGFTIITIVRQWRNKYVFQFT